MPEVRVTESFVAPPDKVWGVVGNFNSLAAWLPGVLSCEIEPGFDGMIRRVTLDDRVARERMVRFDQEQKTLSYQAVGGTFTSYSLATMIVRPAPGERSTVEWRLEFEPREGTSADVLINMVEPLYAGGLANLKTLVEDRR